MTAFLFLQKFDDGKPITIPFKAVTELLSRYGTLSSGLGDLELSLPEDAMAASCTIAGDQASGVTCIGFERPYYDTELRRLVWACMQRFGCAVFDDTLNIVCTGTSAGPALPQNLLADAVFGMREISSAQQLWPGDLEQSPATAPGLPALIYKNPNVNGRNFQLFDFAEFDKKHLYFELPIVPAACNAGTLRVLSNVQMRVELAVLTNPEFALLYRYSHSESSLLSMEAPKVGSQSCKSMIISPPPWESTLKTSFIANRKVFSSENSFALRFVQDALRDHQIKLDGGAKSIDALASVLDALHAAYLVERNASQDTQAFESAVAIEWALLGGAYLGNLIRNHIGAQWGFCKRVKQQIPALRTHRGRHCNPHLAVLDHVINGPRSSVSAYYRGLLESCASAAPRTEDVVKDIPGFCDILLGIAVFTGDDNAGLPLAELIPRDKLDFSVDSLRYLDQYLAAVAPQFKTLPGPAMANIVVAAGAYLGEVIRSNTPEAGYWHWACYDDVALDQPDFVQKRPRIPAFFAILDGRDQMMYPLAQVEYILTNPDSDTAHHCARHVICPLRGEFSGTMLDDFKIEAAIEALPAGQHDYPHIEAPHWVSDGSLAQLHASWPGLLRKGRVVWAHMVQANTGIFEFGLDGLPGEIVYDPQGLLSAEELAPIAKTLFGLRQREQELDDKHPEQAQLLAIAKHLNAEITRAFGMPVPRTLSAEPLLLSTVYFERKHLVDSRLVLPYFPVLISDELPGCAMVLPARWWPQKLLDRAENAAQERRRADWSAAWEKLAAGRNEEDEAYFQHRVNALRQYADWGIGRKRMQQLIALQMRPFQADTYPRPLEWEWDLWTELDSYGENLLKEVEADRARGGTLLVPQAQQAFVARYTSLLIQLHSLLRCTERKLPNESFRIEPDEIQYAALGLVVGCEAAALQMARMLCLAWRSPVGMYKELIRPEVRACFSIFAKHLGLPVPPLVPFKATPHLDALVEGDRWRLASVEEFSALMESACTEHTESAPQGPFQGLPAALMLMLKLREMAGLANPKLTHPLFVTPLGFPGIVSMDVACGDLLDRVGKRMTRNGFREDSIVRAVVSRGPLDVDSSDGSKPLRPDLHPGSIQFGPGKVREPHAHSVQKPIVPRGKLLGEFRRAPVTLIDVLPSAIFGSFATLLVVSGGAAIPVGLLFWGRIVFHWVSHAKYKVSLYEFSLVRSGIWGEQQIDLSKETRYFYRSSRQFIGAKVVFVPTDILVTDETARIKLHPKLKDVDLLVQQLNELEKRDVRSNALAAYTDGHPVDCKTVRLQKDLLSIKNVDVKFADIEWLKVTGGRFVVCKKSGWFRRISTPVNGIANMDTLKNLIQSQTAIEATFE